MNYIPKSQLKSAYKPSNNTGTDGTVGRVLDYLDECAEAISDVLENSQGMSKKAISANVTGYLPNRYGLGRYLGVPVSVIDSWQQEYEEFADVLEYMDTVSTDTLINHSLVGTFREGISKKLMEKNGSISPDNTPNKSETKSINYYFTYPHDKADLDEGISQKEEKYEEKSTLEVLRALKDE